MPIRVPRVKRAVLVGTVAALAGVSLAIVAGSFIAKDSSASLSRHQRSAASGIGDARAFQASYERWKAQHVANEADRILVLPLAYTKGLSARFTKAHGQARLDLRDGTIAVEVSGLPAKEAFDLWLVDNRPGQSVRPEPGDNVLRVGRLEPASNAHALREQLGRELLTGFALDLIVVAPAGGDPGTDGLLFATPSLFQRLYYSEQSTPIIASASGQAPSSAWSPFSVLIPRPAWAQGSGGTSLARTIERGRRLFFEETFNGNGRTCGTCHDAENNLTIDPEFIARLPKNDPLFVAEFRDALKCDNPRTLTGCKFEHPGLMRRFGLILENVDGFNNPGVMRGTPHTLALTDSRGADKNLLGWSGDGAPVDGTLRSFAIGAVTQHFTKTLRRKAGEDFRLPTARELDAMEAFQLSLGRQKDVDLALMIFKNPTIEQGKQLFLLDNAGGGSCNACHQNAGAKANFGAEENRNFNTGVEDLLTPAQRRDARGNVIRPRDGGLGPTPGTDANGFTFFGDGSFNTPVALEAAFKKTFFHNNAVDSLEEAVAFYISDTFGASDSGPALALTTTDVDRIAKFLRVLGAREKIRSATATLHNAREADSDDVRGLLDFSISEDGHAIRILNERGLHRDAVQQIRDAKELAERAKGTRLTSLRSTLIGRAIANLKAACGKLVQEPSCADLEDE
jgi:cytochrome c peroxidase